MSTTQIIALRWPEPKPAMVWGLSSLEQRAARLYPDSEYLRREWLRAVAVVRSTRNGWHLDQPVERKQ